MSLALPGLGGGGTNIVLSDPQINFVWGNIYDSAGGYEDLITKIVVDTSFTYICGIFSHPTIYNKGTNTILDNNADGAFFFSNYKRGFIGQYDNSGIIKWRFIIKSTIRSNDTLNDITINNNTVYSIGTIGLSGEISAIDVFYSTNGVITITNTIKRRANLGEGIILTAFNNNTSNNIIPTLKWFKIIDTSGTNSTGDTGQSIVCDRQNNAVCLGNVSSGNTIISMGSVNITGTSSDENYSTICTRPNGIITQGCLISKYNSSGQHLWACVLDSFGGGTCFGNRITVDNSDNIYVIGNIAGTRIIDSSSNTLCTRPNGRGQGIFIVKYMSNGSPSWSYILDSSGNFTDTGTGIQTDSQNNVIITGNVFGSTIIDNNNKVIATRTINSETGILTVKYNSSGDLLWSRIINSYSTTNIQTSGNNIGIDASNDIYITGAVGYNRNTIIQDDLSNNIVFRQRTDLSAGLLIAKYSKDGNSIWGVTIDSSDISQSHNIGKSIFVDNSKNIYIGGGVGVNNTTSFNDNTNKFIINRTVILSGIGNKYGQGAFFAKLSISDVSYSYINANYNIPTGNLSFDWRIAYNSIKPANKTPQYTITNLTTNQPVIKTTNTSYTIHLNENNDKTYVYNARISSAIIRPSRNNTINASVLIPGYFPNNFSVDIISPIEISFNFYLHPSMNQYVSNVSLQYNPSLLTISNTIVTQTSLSSGTPTGMNSIYTDKLVPDTSYGNTIDYDFRYNIRGLQARSPWTKEFRTPRFDDPSSVIISSITSNSITIQFNNTTKYSWLLISGENRGSYTVNQSGGDVSYSIGSINADAINPPIKYNCTISGLNSNTTYGSIFNVRALYRYGYFTETTVSGFTTAVSPIVITLIEPTSSSVKITWTLSGPSLGLLLSQSIVGTDVISTFAFDTNSITISGLFAAKIYSDWTLSTTFTNSTGPIRTPVKQFATLVDFATVGAITPKIYVDAQYFPNTISGVKTTKDISYQLSDSTRWISQYNPTTISGTFYKEGLAAYPTYNNDGSYSYIRFGTNTSSTISGNYLNFGPQTYNINSSGLTIIGVGRFYSTEQGIAERIIDINNGNSLFPSVTINRDYSGSIVTTDNIGYYTLFTNGGNNTFNSIIQQNVIAPTKWIIFGGRYTSNTISYLTDSSNVSVIKSGTLPSIVSDRSFSNTYIAKSAVIYSGTTFVDTYSNLDVRELIFFDGTMTDASFAAIGQQLYNKYNAPPSYNVAKNAAKVSAIALPSDPLTPSNITTFSADISFTIAEKAANITNITITPLPNGASLIKPSLPLIGSSPYTVTLSGLDVSSTYSGLYLNVFYGGITSFATQINAFSTLRITRSADAGASLQYAPTYDISTLTVKHAWNPSGYIFVPENPAIKYSIDLCGALAYSNLIGTSYNEPSTRSNIYDTSYNYRLYTTNVSGELSQSVALKIPGLVPSVIFPLATLRPTSTDISFYLDPSLNLYLQLIEGITVTITENISKTTVATQNYNSYSSNGFYSITNISGLIPFTTYTISARSKYSSTLIQGKLPSNDFIDPTFDTPGYDSPNKSVINIIYSPKPTSCDISFTVSFAKDLSSLSISGMSAGVTSNIGLLTVPSGSDNQSYGITLSGLVPGTTYNTTSNLMQIVARFGSAATYSSVADLSFRTDVFAAPNGFNAFNFNRTSCDISFRIPTYANMLTDLSVVGISSLILSKPSIPVNLTDTSATYIISLSGLTSGPYTNISFGAIYGIYRAFSAFTFNIPVFNSTFSLTASSITQNSMIISWTSPNPSYTISGITINWQTGSTTIGTNSYTISGLSPSTSYTITVTEIYANGLSASGSITKSTIPAFVSSFTIYNVAPGTDNINIYYSNPNPQYTLNNYTVLYKESSVSNYTSVNTNLIDYTITGLKQNKTYNICVSANYINPTQTAKSNTLFVLTDINWNSSFTISSSSQTINSITISVLSNPNPSFTISTTTYFYRESSEFSYKNTTNNTIIGLSSGQNYVIYVIISYSNAPPGKNAMSDYLYIRTKTS